MALKTRNYRDGIIIIRDGATPTSNELEVLGAEGDLSFSETQTAKVIMRRGAVDSLREGDEEPINLSFTIKFEQWEAADGDDTGISVRDALKQTGNAATWVSTGDCGPYVVDIVFKIKDACNPGAFEVLTFEKFIAEGINFTEAQEYNTLAISGRCVSFPPVRTYEPAP